MNRVFTISIEDDAKVIGLQIGMVVQRESDGEKGVNFFQLSDDIREHDEWWFKVSGRAERIVESEEKK